jgi:PAS domain S-box-containing protein
LHENLNALNVFTMEHSLAEQMSSIAPGGHMCLFYERDPVEQMPALVPFIRQGLENHEQFIYIADDQTTHELAAHLERGGINVNKECKSGRLKLCTRQEWRQPGDLDSSRKATQVREFVAQAAREGFKGIRFAVEMTWTLGPDIDAQKLEHWEATINTLFKPEFPARIICQYNRSRLAPEVLMAGLHTHPQAIIGQTVYPNPFYEAPLILKGKSHAHSPGGPGSNGNGNGNGHGAAGPRFDWMMSQLEQAREIERYRLESAVLHRVNERLTHFAECSPVPLHWVDSRGIIQWANQAELDLLGCAKQEHIGRHISEFHVEPEVCDEFIRRVGNEENIKDFPATLKTKSGEIKHVLIDSSVLHKSERSICAQCHTRDITAQKRAETALAGQIAGLTRLHQLGNTLVGGNDFKGMMMMQAILASMVELHGTDRGVFFLYNEHTRKLTPEVSIGFTSEQLAQLAAVPLGTGPCGKALVEGKRIIVSDMETDADFAHLRPFSRASGYRASHSTPIRTREGRPLGVLTVCFTNRCVPTPQQLQFADMHAQQAAGFIERFRAEETVLATAQQLRAIIDSSPECIKLVAQDGTLLDMNAAGCRMVRAARSSDVIGMNVYDIVAPEDRERFKAMNGRVCAGQTENLQFQMIDLAGERHYMETHAVPLRDTHTQKFNHLAITRDVTAQRAASETQRFLAAVVESSEDAIVTKNLDGIITSWNKGAEFLFGYTAPEVIGKPVSILIPEERQDEEPNILSRIRKGQRIEHYETVRRRKDGTLLNISLTVSPVRDGEGRIIGASKIARNISERKRVEAELTLATERLARANEELERRVLERTASLREVIAQMEEFSYSVSHDLRAPVRAMKGYAQATIEDYGNHLDATGRDYLDRIVRGSTRMERLIHDVLTYSRLARSDMRLQPVSLQKLVPDIIQQYPAMQAPSAEINVREPLHDVLGHEPSLTQAISNLLSNSVKFVQPGTKPTLDVWTETAEGKVRLWIKDNGIGIKPEHQRRLFGMFERVHQDNNYEGTGIGLAIVRKALEKMGGRAGVESDGVHGSSFWIELPAAVRNGRA